MITRQSRHRRPGIFGTLACAGMALASGQAFADGEPRAWEIAMQAAASPIREHIDSLYDEILVIITGVVILVVGLLLYTILRFNRKAHPVPTKATHNAVLEMSWTVAPVIILTVIAVPSFKLMYYMDDVRDPQMTINVTAHQWYWTYAYPTEGGLTFDSNVLSADQDAKEGKPRLLGVDNPLVVPVNTTIRVLVTSTDVIHSWFVPSMGVQEYAVPGRTNHAWFSVDRLGTYYGQCNQLCGINHSFMPIEIDALSKADFARWLAKAKNRFAYEDRGRQDSADRSAASAARG